ncbi:hypothetical protein AXF42_Ash013430 [Apostasia shenzhenica]|uniref:Uncharacterized protein n=1 Tax=Apostasia shenzhenica TaxID=1088818 RepID=A0A2I0A466_9ASPA|nr:hypothetical protein AXF42_Ash013430 [Apostasia shenzhenica]
MASMLSFKKRKSSKEMASMSVTCPKWPAGTRGGAFGRTFFASTARPSVLAVTGASVIVWGFNSCVPFPLLLSSSIAR